MVRKTTITEPLGDERTLAVTGKVIGNFIVTTVAEMPQLTEPGDSLICAGERFEISYRASQANQEGLRVQGAVANYWKDIGVRVNFDNVSDQVFRNSQGNRFYPP